MATGTLAWDAGDADSSASSDSASVDLDASTGAANAAYGLAQCIDLSLEPPVSDATFGMRFLAPAQSYVDGDINVSIEAAFYSDTACTPGNLITGGATTNGGSITLATNGEFVFTPLVGDAAASDSFQYQVTDGAATTAARTVTINLKNRVWYVKNNGVTTNNADAAIQFYLGDVSGNHANRGCIDDRNNSTQANGGLFGETDFFFGNDPVGGPDSGIAVMENYATSVDNTWFTVNGNTTTTSPTPLALGLGTIQAGTCETVPP